MTYTQDVYKRQVHNITVYCEARYAERKNKEKSCYADFQETDFRVLAVSYTHLDVYKRQSHRTDKERFMEG